VAAAALVTTAGVLGDRCSKPCINAFPYYRSCSKGTHYFHRVVRLVVISRSVATGTCCVESIGSPLSLAFEQKPSKGDRNTKLNTSLKNGKSKSDLKCGNILPQTVWLAGVSYCMQLFNIGCVGRCFGRLA